MYHRVQLSNGEEIALSVAPTAEHDVADSAWTSKLSDVLPAIAALSEDLASAFARAKPDKASVEFGIKLDFATSKLLAVLCSSSASADLKVKFDWEGKKNAGAVDSA